MTKDANELAAGVANKVLDEIESTRLWDDNNYVRGYVDGLARAMQIVQFELTRIAVPHCDDGTEGEEDANT